MTAKAGPDDSPTKHIEMFKRRAAKGQCFQQPCFGCCEFAASFELVDGDMPASTLPPDQLNHDFGRMLYGIDFKGGEHRPMFFRGRLGNGVPDVAKARAEGFTSWSRRCCRHWRT
jgi:CRISPR-associated protein Cas5d